MSSNSKVVGESLLFLFTSLSDFSAMQQRMLNASQQNQHIVVSAKGHKARVAIRTNGSNDVCLGCTSYSNLFFFGILSLVLMEFNIARLADKSISATFSSSGRSNFIPNTDTLVQAHQAENNTRVLDQIIFPPLFFGLGQGTTGTHTAFLATCHLNLTSVHGIETCLEGQVRADVDKHVLDGIKAHTQAVKYYKRLRSCAHPSFNCTFNDALTYVNELKRFIREVIDSSIGAVHDTPYSYMTNYVLHVAKEVRGPMSLILLQTEREPNRWAERRAQAHPIAIVCKEFFMYDQPARRELGALDLDKCMELALSRSPLPTIFSDVFVSYRQLIAEVGGNTTKLEQLKHFNQVAIETYQESMRQLARPALLYNINLWEKNYTDRVFAEQVNEALWSNNNNNLPQEVQDQLVQSKVHLMKEPIPHRKGRYSKFHPFVKGLVKLPGAREMG